MRAAISIFVFVAILALSGVNARAQTNTLTTQAVFPLKFRATCRSLNTNGTRIVNSELTELDIMANALGTNLSHSLVRSGTNIFPGVAVAYNPTLDSIQVINTNSGTLIANVIDFSDVAATRDNRVQTRFAFMFLPGLPNSIGSAVLNSVGAAPTNGLIKSNAIFIGNVQFALSGSELLGADNGSLTNSALGRATNPTTAGAVSGLMPGASAAPIPGFGVATGFLANTNVVNSTNLVANTNGFGVANLGVSNALPQTSTRVCLGFFFASGPPVTVSLAAPAAITPTMPGISNGVTNAAPNGPAVPAPAVAAPAVPPAPTVPAAPAFPGTATVPPPTAALPPPTPALPPGNSATPALPVPGANTNTPGFF